MAKDWPVKWQLMRFNSVEVALLDLEMMDIEAEVLRDFDAMDEWGRLALAFKKSSGDRALEVLRRYKTTAERAYHRSLAVLEKMRKERPAEPPCQPRQAPETKPDPQPEQPTNNVVPIRPHHKIGRNERCPCNSGLKFKRCCLDKPAPQERWAS
jgi:uncharacterized protein YecA (UPF0149 family)